MSETKRKMPEGKRFKPGQSGNPKGRTPIPEDVKAARKLTSVEFDRAVGRLLFVSRERLEEIANDEKEPVLDSLVARILLKGIKESAKAELNYFVERALGKVPEGLNVSGNLNSSITEFIASRKRAQPSDEE